MACGGNAQSDSLAFNPVMGIGDGIYLSYYDFRHGLAIKKADVVSNSDTNMIDFIAKVLMQERFQFKRAGQLNTSESKKVFGFFQNNAFHVLCQEEFYRVPLFGAISYLVAKVKVVSPAYYDPRFGYQTTTTTTEMKEFLMSLYDGSVQEFTMHRAESLMCTDLAFYESYKKLSERNKRKQIYSLIRRFNELHPAYILQK
jgi:hypothetical protein